MATTMKLTLKQDKVCGKSARYSTGEWDSAKVNATVYVPLDEAGKVEKRKTITVTITVA